MSAAFRYPLQFNSGGKPVSPGTFHSSKLCALDSTTVFVASRNHVYKLTLPTNYDQFGPTVKTCINEGKKGQLIPCPLDTAAITESYLGLQIPHKYEIQTITCRADTSNDASLVATSDSRGNACVAIFTNGTADRTVYTYIESAANNELGWSGASLHPTSPVSAPALAVAHFFAKSVRIIDIGSSRVLRTLYLVHPPTRISHFFPTSPADHPLLAITESHQLSFWDVRVAERGGCVQRLTPSGGSSEATLYALSTLAGGTPTNPTRGIVAVGGSDRAVTVYDAARWSTCGRWRNPTKSDISAIAFSPLAHREICYVAGTESEIAVGEWSGRSESAASTYRIDGRVVGMAVTPMSTVSTRHDDMLMGMTENGTLYCITEASELYSGMEALRSRKAKKRHSHSAANSHASQSNPRDQTEIATVEAMDTNPMDGMRKRKRDQGEEETAELSRRGPKRAARNADEAGEDRESGGVDMDITGE